MGADAREVESQVPVRPPIFQNKKNKDYKSQFVLSVSGYRLLGRIRRRFILIIFRITF